MSCRRLFAGDTAAGYGFLRDRKKRLSLGAVEYIQHAGLGRLNHRRDRYALHFDINQGRLRREIEIPQVVMYELLVPRELAGVRIQRQQGVGEAIAAEPLATGLGPSVRSPASAVAAITSCWPGELACDARNCR